MSNLIPFNDIEQMGVVAAKSNLFGFKNPEEAMSLMILCQAEGMHPGIAMRDYHVIQGRPALKADAMLARFQQAGGSVNWKTYTDTEVTGIFSHPLGGTLELTWTFAQASKIGLTGKDNWKKYPRAMLRARVISEAIRTIYPGCLGGVYAVEEVQDFDEKFDKPHKVKDMGKAEVVDKGKVTIIVEDPPIPENAIALYVPGKEEAYSHFEDEASWIEGYAAMIARITNSPKLNDEDKKKNLDEIKKLNGAQLTSMSGSSLVRLRAAIVNAGGTLDPKSGSVLPPQEEVSESQS